VPLGGLNMADIFISSSREDQPSVMAITEELKALGVTVWTDQDIGANENFIEAMDTALRDSKIMVLCITPQFLASDWCRMEIGFALSRAEAGEGRMVPVLLSDAPRSSLLERFHTLDARKLPPKVIAATIKRALDGDA
jgi:TIR domain